MLTRSALSQRERLECPHRTSISGSRDPTLTLAFQEVALLHPLGSLQREDALAFSDPLPVSATAPTELRPRRPRKGPSKQQPRQRGRYTTPTYVRDTWRPIFRVR